MCQIRLSVMNPLLQIKREILAVFVPKFRPVPIVAGDHFAADRRVAVAFNFIVACAVTHGVIEFDYESDVATAVTRQNKRPDRLQNERALAI